MRHQLTVSDYCSDWFLKERSVTPGWSSGIRSREDVINSYRGLKFDFIEINHSYWDDVSGEKIKELCDRAGFPIYTYNFFVNLALPENERKEGLKETRRILEKTVAMGASHVMFLPAAVDDRFDLETQRKWLMEAMREAAKIAESINVMLLCENCDWPPIRPFMGSGMQCVAICKEVNSPAFKLIYDCCAPLFVEEDTLKVLQAALPFMEHVHLKNSRLVKPNEQIKRYLDSNKGLRYTGCLLTEGAINIPEVMKALRNAGYSKTLSVEYQGIEDPVPSLAANIEYVRRLEQGQQI